MLLKHPAMVGLRQLRPMRWALYCSRATQVIYLQRLWVFRHNHSFCRSNCAALPHAQRVGIWTSPSRMYCTCSPSCSKTLSLCTWVYRSLHTTASLNGMCRSLLSLCPFYVSRERITSSHCFIWLTWVVVGQCLKATSCRYGLLASVVLLHSHWRLAIRTTQRAHPSRNVLRRDCNNTWVWKRHWTRAPSVRSFARHQRRECC